LRWFFVAQGGQQRETENQPKKLALFLLRDRMKGLGAPRVQRARLP
jgi:hypothetical protein